MWRSLDSRSGARHVLGLCASAALLAHAPCAQEPLDRQPAAAPAETRDTELAARLDDYLNRSTAFGFSGVVLVAKEGRIVLCKGYGIADRASGTPFTADTAIDLGSVTKQITAAAILKLEMQNDPKRILWLPLDELRVFAAAVFPHVREVVPSVVGEPMTYPHWQDFLDLCAQYGVFAEIYTNGTYLDEKTLPPLGPVVQKLIVSMDGASRATFNQLRKPADFDDVCARLEVVRAWRAGLSIEERPRLQIHSVLTLHWVDELPEMVRLAKRHGVDELSVSHVVVYSDYWRGFSPSADPARTDAALRAAGEEARRLGVSVHLPRLFGSGENVSHRAAPAFPVRDKVEPIPAPEGREYWCQYLWREAFVAHSGAVAPCCGLGRPAVGNLRTDLDLKKLFGHPTFAAMREGMIAGKLHEACARCPQLSMYGALDYRNASFAGTYASLEAVLAEQRQRTPER